MAVALVVLPVKPPAVLEGQTNGKLDPAILVSTPGLSGGPTVRLVETATRCWVAMTAAAGKAGITLKTSSYADSYRTYQVQVTTFTSRYQLEPTNNGYRLWDSDGNGVRERWWKKDGVATAAVPGTSNHGWAIAVDVANATGARLAWLERYAVGFGWSWELVPEEPWHLRNYSGDDIPAKVLAYEEEQRQMSEQNQHNADAYGVQLVKMLDKVHVYATPEAPPGTVLVTGNPLADAIRKLQADVTELKARPPVQPAPIDVDALAAALVAALAESGLPVSVSSVAEIATATVDQHKLRL